ncbi:hypothetical protein IKU74_07595 [bacterium]|nr:hypothetical protein [bacterium]
MGMAASQARLLSITARLTDNENTGQDISTAKIQLTDKMDQLNKNYLAALDATKLTVLTGFNGSDEVYTDISYGLMTGFQTVAAGKQYVVTNKDGKVLISEKMAQAYESGNGDLNKFLATLGYSQANIDITKNTAGAEDEDVDKLLAKQKIHDAWDVYLTSVGLEFEDEEHGLEFGYTTLGAGAFNGFATYTYDGVTTPLNYEGTTPEQRQNFDYAMALTEAYYGDSDSANTLKTAANPENAEYIQYLTNIFQRIQQTGYYTEADETKTLKDNTWFEEQLRKGELQLEYYSAVDKKFISTSIDQDTNIQEVEDEREIARVEQQYKMDMADAERKDNIFDMQLRKLDTEHNALQTEYDSVKSIIDKNVEKTFNTFS